MEPQRLTILQVIGRLSKSAAVSNARNWDAFVVRWDIDSNMAFVRLLDFRNASVWHDHAGIRRIDVRHRRHLRPDQGLDLLTPL
jgi:hypothetical protein